MWVNSLDLPHHDHCSEYLVLYIGLKSKKKCLWDTLI